MEETLQELFASLKGSFPNGKIPPGKNPDVECIRLTLDPVNPEHRPLAFYLVIQFIVMLTEGRLSATEHRFDAIPCSRIHIPSRPEPTNTWILVPSTDSSYLRSSPYHGYPWCRLGSLINLVRYKSCKTCETSTHFRP